MKSVSKALLIIAGLASMAFAADKPNFSGDWKLNAAKSNFGPIPPPTSYTRKIAHAEPTRIVERHSIAGRKVKDHVVMCRRRRARMVEFARGLAFAFVADPERSRHAEVHQKDIAG